MFRAQDGQPLHSDTPTRLMSKLVAEAGVSHARDPAITLRVYAHVLREHTSGVADVFAVAVNQ